MENNSSWAKLLWTFSVNLPGRTGDHLRTLAVQTLCASCGKDLYVPLGVSIIHPSRLTLGDNVGFSKDVYVDAGGKVAIGNDVGIGPFVKILSVNRNYDVIGRNIAEQGHTSKEIIIGDGCWIGADSQILAGVVVGEHSVIGAGSVLRKSVRPYSIVQGNPGRVVGFRVPVDEYFKS